MGRQKLHKLRSHLAALHLMFDSETKVNGSIEFDAATNNLLRRTLKEAKDLAYRIDPKPEEP